MNLRDLYKHMPLAHIVTSTDVASTTVCPWRFKLPRFIGVSPGRTDSSPLVGKVAHEVLSELLLKNGPVMDVWNKNLSNPDEVYDILTRESDSSITQIVSETLTAYRVSDEAKRKEMTRDATDRVLGLLIGFVRGFMSREPPPTRIITELPITNVRAGQTGVLDALIESSNGLYTVLDWKTYGFERPTSYGYDHFQVVVNGLLANFRNKKDECNFTSCRLAIAYLGGVYFPNSPSQTLLERILVARQYALSCLAGGSPRASLPPEQVCWQCKHVFSCTFFRKEQLMSMNDELPFWYKKIRNELWWRRWVVLGVRAVSHKTAILVEEALSRLGEEKGWEELKSVGILDDCYTLVNHDVAKRTLTLEKGNGKCLFGKRATVSVIAIERPDIHPLACIRTKGSVLEVNGNKVEVIIYGDNLRRRANQFQGLPLVLLRDEIDLTARELESIGFVHQLLGNLISRGESDALPQY